MKMKFNFYCISKNTVIYCLRFEPEQKGFGSPRKNLLIMKKRYLFLSLIGTVLSLASCGQGANEKDDGKIKITTTFAPIYDFTKRIVGDKGDVLCLVGDEEPHDFSITKPQDRSFAQNSDLIFALGGGLDDYSKGLNDSKRVEVSSGIEFRKVGNVVDPHIWLSIKDSEKMLSTIADKIIATDKANEAFYKANKEKALKAFEALDQEYTEGLKAEKGKTIVTSHEAFYYLCKDYGLNQYGIKDIADNDPTGQVIAKVVNFIIENNIHYINKEDLDEADVSNQVIEEVKKKQPNYQISLVAINAYEGVDVAKWNDSEDGDSYLSVMRQTLKVLGQTLK